jgi:signal transduction histidine kinase
MKKHWLFTWRGLTRSIAVRFALLVFLLQVLAVVGTGVYAERVMWERFERHEKVPVIRLRDGAMAQYRAAGIDGLTRLIKERVSDRYTHDIALMLSDPSGLILAGNLANWPTHMVGTTNWSAGPVRVRGTGRDQHMGMMTTELKGGYRLLVGTAIIPEERIISAYARSILLSAVISIAVSILIAWIASIMIAKHLNGLAKIAAKAIEGDFSGRLTISGSGDPFDDLMNWINQMLNRLESLVGELRLVGGGLAHDLRSPITRLRVTLDRALRESKDSVSLAAMQKMMVETDTLLAMLNMTLQISNAETGGGRERFTEVDVSKMLWDLAEIYGPLAEEKGFKISVNVADGISVLLHRELLGQALSNLIDNALNYADGGSNIMLSAYRHNKIISITVADDGVGIPVHRRADAKRRYGRLDNSRSLPGAGLGLSLVEAVARLHGGDMTFADNAPGLVVTMKLPDKKL